MSMLDFPMQTLFDAYIADNPKFFPFFKDAEGALDGMHITAHPQSEDHS
jgi:hypothetical protein